MMIILGGCMMMPKTMIDVYNKTRADFPNYGSPLWVYGPKVERYCHFFRLVAVDTTSDGFPDVVSLVVFKKCSYPFTTSARDNLGNKFRISTSNHYPFNRHSVYLSDRYLTDCIERGGLDIEVCISGSGCSVVKVPAHYINGFLAACVTFYTGVSIQDSITVINEELKNRK